ncbi:proline dehydrogenase [Kocuria polaris]|nr:proline dehydrogenase [Kocuria polaris]
MLIDEKTVARAADTLRAWALDEELKARVMADHGQASLARRIARRYTAGETIDGALALVTANAARGHRGSIECVGESVRDAEIAARETQEFVSLARLLGAADEPATLSFDLSHIGSVVSPDLGLANVTSIAQAAREAGTSVMISAEGSDRTDLVLDIYERVASNFPETGITLQARLHRTPEDLARCLELPGPVRVVKGAFLEPEAVAYPRDSEPMTAAYLSMATTLVRAGHRVNLATHDPQLVHALTSELGEDLRGAHVEFEMLQGLGNGLLDTLNAEGYATREYVVYGPQWWLYVLNRIAEHPERALLALADLNASTD